MPIVSGPGFRAEVRPWLAAALLTLLASVPGAAQVLPQASSGANGGGVETILIFRHGEKPDPAGFGQLTCQGLNRSLALPGALAGYGPPTHLFAPDPAADLYPDGYLSDGAAAGPFAYIRPLATIEPLAIGAGLPVNTAFAYDDPAGLAEALVQPGLRSATVFVAWEHGHIGAVVDAVLGNFSPALQPAGWPPSGGWAEDDYDSLYLLKITTAPNQHASATFAHACEGLGDGGSACPFPAGKKELSAVCPGPHP